MRLFPDIYKKRNDSVKTTLMKGIVYCAVLLILMGVTYIPSVSSQGQTQPPTKTQANPQAQPAGTQPAPATPAPPPPPPKLSILLLIDTSGSMGSNNKMENAKAAAIRAIQGALKPAAIAGPQGTQPPTTPPVAPVIAGSSIPGIPVKIAQEFNKNLQAMEELQKLLGKDIRQWLSKNRSADMGKILKNCNKLMEGLAFEQKSILMKKLNPLVEKMHYSIAARVNQELRRKGLTKGLKYVIPGKTPTHPEFGGMFTLKPSDHDAIYFGEGADEAVKLHKELAKQYGDDFLQATESCLESSKYTIESFEKGLRKQAFQRFSGPKSNLDWMRSPSGSKWVQEYVDKAGTVVDLDNLDDVAKIKPAGESGSALRSLSSYTDDELKAIGVAMDRSSLSGMGYNLGLQSDFERQLMLNRTRKGLEKGLVTATTEDTAMLMAKYGPRYEEILQSANVNVQGTRWEGYVEKLKAAGKKAKGGAALEAAEKQLVSEFDEFAGFVRQQSMAKQMDKFAQLKEALKAANQSGADDATIAGLRSQMTDLVDDTQAALHNYQQLYGKDFADDIVKQISTTHDDFARGLSRRLQNSPWIVGEESLETCVRTEMGLLDDAARAATVPSKLVISDATTLWQYARQNPGHVFAKAAQFGAYAWMSYEILSQLEEGDYDGAISNVKMFAGTEAATQLSSYMLASKFGPWAGPGVVLAAAGGFMIGNAAANWAINSRVDEMSLQMMTGYSNDGSKAFNQNVPPLPSGENLSMGLLEYLTKARLDRTTDQNTGRPINWIEFDNPHEAASLTDEQIMAQFKPGTYGNSTVYVDDGGNVSIHTVVGEKIGRMGGEPGLVPDIRIQNMSKNQIIAHTRLQQMYQAMRGKYNADLESGNIQPGSQNVPSGFRYVDPHSSIPGSEFDIPNPSGMSMHEFTYYRMMFENSYGQWALNKNAEFSQSSMYWGANMENAYKAKWSMFKQFMAKMAEGKIKDKEFQEKLDKDSPENLVALKLLADQGIPFFLDGKKLTGADIEKIIEKKLEERRELLKDMEDGVIQIDLPDELEKLLGDLSAMTLGDIEIGIMPYSGGCSSVFNLFGFSRDPGELEAAITSLSSGGGTPMSPALYQARHAIATVGKGQAGTIILLCDGQNDCAEDPVKAAENIRTSSYPANPGGLAADVINAVNEFRLVPMVYAQAASQPQFRPIDMTAPIPPERRNIPITVSTVGFQVSDSEQAVLDDIANAGGGVSGSAQDMDQLTQAFSTAIRQATGAVVPMGGGGGYVSGYRETDMTTVLIVVILAACAMMATIILLLRRRRLQTAGGPRVSGTAAGPAAGTLDILYSDGGYKSFSLNKQVSRLGRSSSSDLVLHDDEVSGTHAELHVLKEGYFIRDLGSSNGTFVNGQQVTESWVRPGDEIQLGTTKMTLKSG